MTVAARIRVTGIVQGVGFRPFVWRLARDLRLAGWVRNDTEGVEIAAEGAAEGLRQLIERLRREAPPLARIDAVRETVVAPQGARDFAIVESAPGARLGTSIGADVGVCPACLDELFAPDRRRWRHAFITCTHCGPRYAVTRGLPYDRPQTTLAGFALCVDCTSEYTDPADRRFHAETICCPACGPRLALEKLGAGEAAPDEDAIAATLALLRQGAIVAIKGLGGFHLACDAGNAQAVARLREAKNREAKPFAVMFANAASAAAQLTVTAAEQALLEGRERPIVLLHRHAEPSAVEAFAGVAPGLDTLGVLLPTTPIHYLLFHEAAGRPAGTGWLAAEQPLALVMTSANPGGEPIVADDAEARQRLAGIADYLLGHDRPVAARCDDSVIKPVAGVAQFIRRSRGHVPHGIALGADGPSVLAFGAHLKNTLCVSRGDQAFLSAHIGDLDTAATCAFLEESAERLLDLLAVRPQAIAHDLHPDYYSSRAAAAFAERHGLPLIAVQHHHAHIAAVCAEAGIAEPVLGLALDGVGLGDDGTAWGGELLLVEGRHFSRLGRLRPLALPGGDRAAREPWRLAAAALQALGRGGEIRRRFAEPAAGTVAAMLEKQLNCPVTSSAGRLFDAAAGLLGLCASQAYEAQAAMLLEQAAQRHVRAHGLPALAPGGGRIERSGELWQLDTLPMLASLIDCPQSRGDRVDAAAAGFHGELAAALADWAATAAREQGVHRVALAGGCFFNDLLTTQLVAALHARGLTVLRSHLASPGDAGISLGQAWVARAHLEQ